MNLNCGFLIGNVTRDPEIRYTPKGTAVLDLDLAVDRIAGTEDARREEVLFVDIVLWARLAEIVKQYPTRVAACSPRAVSSSIPGSTSRASRNVLDCVW